jgi:hypothetical protein
MISKQIVSSLAREYSLTILGSGIGTSYYNSGASIVQGNITLAQHYNFQFDEEIVLLSAKIPLSKPSMMSIGSRIGDVFEFSPTHLDALWNFQPNFTLFVAKQSSEGEVVSTYEDLSCELRYKIRFGASISHSFVSTSSPEISFFFFLILVILHQSRSSLVFFHFLASLSTSQQECVAF